MSMAIDIFLVLCYGYSILGSFGSNAPPTRSIFCQRTKVSAAMGV